MTTVSIADASHDQLFHHCSVVLGLEVKKIGTSKAQLIAKIEQAAPGTTTIPLSDQADSPAQAEAVANTADAAAALSAQAPQRLEIEASKLHGMSPRQAAAHHHDPKIDILIAETPEPGGDRDVPVSVNGVQFLIPRGKWTTVPYRLYENLKNAVQTVYTPVQDDIGRLNVESRDSYSYPFSTKNEPSDAELTAWRARTANVELA